MASYDKQKLLALMEQRRAAHLALTDLSDRWRDAKDSEATITNHIRIAGIEYHAPSGFVDRLLALPLNEAAALTADEVQGYTRQIGDVTHRYQTEVNFQNFQNYVKAREKKERLAERLEPARAEFNDRFAIIPQLRAAVRAWGFSDPELEVN